MDLAAASATQNTLVINCGSSSLKFAVINPATGHCSLQGLAERLGSEQASLSYEDDQKKNSFQLNGTDHQAAISGVIDLLTKYQLLNTLTGVGHRVVHGGERWVFTIKVWFSEKI